MLTLLIEIISDDVLFVSSPKYGLVKLDRTGHMGFGMVSLDHCVSVVKYQEVN